MVYSVGQLIVVHRPAWQVLSAMCIVGLSQDSKDQEAVETHCFQDNMQNHPTLKLACHHVSHSAAIYSFEGSVVHIMMLHFYCQL